MELVVLSGKGGTGKTTIATALCELSNSVFRVDCDVDAPNLYLYYKGKDIYTSEFIGGKIAKINREKCSKCNACEKVCRFNAIKDFTVDPFLCEGCNACLVVCKDNAINILDEKIANTYISNIHNGKISRAQMEIGSDGSGKLIADLRRKAKDYNKENILTIIDSSPGIGCPVISSITGSDAVLIVTEPTKSGFEDFKRVYDLCSHFNIKVMVCINKYDINEKVSNQIENFSSDLKIVGKIPYDNVVIQSINKLKPITYFEESIARKAIVEMWNNIKKYLLVD